MTELRECVFVDGIRTPNARAHKDKGWFRDVRPDELLSVLYKAMFERNPKIKPKDVEAVFIGTANSSGMQNDIGRLAWLATGLPFSVPSQTICNQCPSGMSATMDAARAIMTGEVDIILAGGVETMDYLAVASIDDMSDLIIGALISAVSAYLCIPYFLILLERIGMTPFVIYRLVLGIVLLLLYA